MKRIAALMMSVLLAAALLAACGKEQNPTADAPGTDAAEDAESGQNSAGEDLSPNEDTQPDPEDPLSEAGEDLEDAAKNTARGAGDALEDTGEALQGATYGDMLRNGQVHDQDGFLKDGENAVTPGAAG